jgi:hypothetical protein
MVAMGAGAVIFLSVDEWGILRRAFEAYKRKCISESVPAQSLHRLDKRTIFEPARGSNLPIGAEMCEHSGLIVLFPVRRILLSWNRRSGAGAFEWAPRLLREIDWECNRPIAIGIKPN